MNDLASGNLAVAMPGIGRGDEVGEMAEAVESSRAMPSPGRRSRSSSARRRPARLRGRKADMSRMANDFEAAVGQIVEAVSSASSQLEVSAGTLTDDRGAGAATHDAVAAASEEASTNVQSVASPPRRWRHPSTRSAARCRNWPDSQ